MNKPTFQAALKRAQEMQGTYKIEQSRCDALYDELKGEDEQAVLDALKRLGRSDKTISYFNIKAFMDEIIGEREYREKVKQSQREHEANMKDVPIEEILYKFPQHVKEIFDNLINKKKMGR